MNIYATVGRLLGELSHADALTARSIASQLSLLVERNPIDARTHRQIIDALAKHALSFAGTWAAPPLSVGETYVLVVRGGAGSVTRLRVIADGSGLAPGACEAAQSFLHVAWEGTTNALARAGYGAKSPYGSGYRVMLSGRVSSSDRIEGGSLGLSFSIALMSQWLNASPDATVAASAQVAQDGRLEPVEHLVAKLRALSEEWPNVRRVIVASTQELPSIEDRFELELIPVTDVVSATQCFGLRLTTEALPFMSSQKMHERLELFKFDNDKAFSGPQWAGLAQQAAHVARSLSNDDSRKAEAFSWALMFALHAGDVDGADYFSKQIRSEDLASLSDASRAWCQIRLTSLRIDTAPELAIDEARTALSVTLSLAPADQSAIEGRARGTLGRALMHAGRFDEALVELRRAADCHRGKVQREQLPRSLCYVATCLRLSGNASGALQVTQQALEHLRAPDIQNADNTPLTFRFVLLERGRCRLALDQPAAAAESFSGVLVNEPDYSYPSLAGLRGLAVANRRISNTTTSDQYL